MKNISIILILMVFWNCNKLFTQPQQVDFHKVQKIIVLITDPEIVRISQEIFIITEKDEGTRWSIIIKKTLKEYFDDNKSTILEFELLPVYRLLVTRNANRNIIRYGSNKKYKIKFNPLKKGEITLEETNEPLPENNYEKFMALYFGTITSQDQNIYQLTEQEETKIQTLPNTNEHDLIKMQTTSQLNDQDKTQATINERDQIKSPLHKEVQSQVQSHSDQKIPPIPDKTKRTSFYIGSGFTYLIGENSNYKMTSKNINFNFIIRQKIHIFNTDIKYFIILSNNLFTQFLFERNDIPNTPSYSGVLTVNTLGLFSLPKTLFQDENGEAVLYLGISNVLYKSISQRYNCRFYPSIGLLILKSEKSFEPFFDIRYIHNPYLLETGGSISLLGFGLKFNIL